MSKDEPPHVPKHVAERIGLLRSTRKEHLDLLQQILSADEGRWFGVDLVILAVMQRSLSLMDGFVLMVEHRNPLCAAPLIRLQIDSIMRLYACSLVDEPDSIALKLLDGTPLYKIKSRDGRPLRDVYLHEKLSGIYPWVSRVYQTTSEFIHLSRPHMLAPVTAVNEDERALEMCVGNLGPQWPERQILEAIDAFAEATRSLLHLCSSWLAGKERVASQRLAAKDGPPAADRDDRAAHS
jgi:hypothetical protein